MRALIFVLSCLIVASLAPAARAEDNASLNATIEKYILEHPDVIIKSLKKYKGRESISAEQSSKLLEGNNSPVVGNSSADITIVEFFDYHCGYCKRFYSTVSTIASEDKKVKFVFKELPILSEDSELAARAALSVYYLDPEKYFGFHSALMKYNGKFEVSKLTDMAKQAGIDEKAFTDGIKSDRVSKEIARNKELAEELDISGTPAIILGQHFLPGYVETDVLKAKIKAARDDKNKS